MAGPVDMRVVDPDQAGEVGSRLFYPQQLSVLGGRGPFAMTLQGGPLGPVFIGANSFTADVRIDCGELLTSFHVNLPLTGRLISVHRGTEVHASPDCAAIYGPQGETVLARWEADCSQLCVKIERTAVEAALRAQLGREVVDPLVELDFELDVTHGPGRSWAQLARALHVQLGQPDALPYSPMVAAPLAEGLIHGLLNVTSRQLRAAAADPKPRVAHPSVHRALDYVHDHVDEPITIADLAVHCGLSVRALQEGFARYVGQSPLQYVRTVRMRRAHGDLLDSNSFTTTVATVAHRWGFTHLGRFAAAHHKVFGEPPAVTLRRPPR